MNRSIKDYYAGPGAATSRSLLPSAASQHRRGNILARDSEVRSLDLFSNNRRSVSLASDDDLSDDRTTSLKLGKISLGSAKPAKSGLDDLLTSADGGKHDYDWLLTPPETPVFPSAEVNECQQSFTAPRGSSTAVSVSTTKSSRLSTNHAESNVSSRPARSNSVTRSSISYSQNNSYSSIRSSSILNTGSSSVSSYNRPSSPITRSSLTPRPSTPSSRTTPSRSSTPSKARSAPTLSSIDKPRPALGSRPSTPGSRPQISTNSTSPATLISSRSSTPTRRSSISSSSSGPTLSASTVRGLSIGRSQTSVSRPGSPSPRIRQQQLVIPPDFSHDTPPNLRTSLPDRPASVGRSRPAPATTAKASTESQGHGSFPRRASSPAVTRGRSVEPKGRTQSNGCISEVQVPRRSSYVPESPSRRNIRASPTTDSNGFGRSISKKSLDMAIKHMDIRNGPGTTRPLTGTVLYPQSIRSATSKIHASQTLNNSASSDLNERLAAIKNGFNLENISYDNGTQENVRREENGQMFGRVSDVDMFESSRYDAILLKEDLNNTNWLLSSDEKSDQGLIFDHSFESLPESFGLS